MQAPFPSLMISESLSHPLVEERAGGRVRWVADGTQARIPSF